MKIFDKFFNKYNPLTYILIIILTTCIFCGEAVISGIKRAREFYLLCWKSVK